MSTTAQPETPHTALYIPPAWELTRHSIGVVPSEPSYRASSPFPGNRTKLMRTELARVSRDRQLRGETSLDKERLESVLLAMLGNVPLPPISLSGDGVVENGYHRLAASLLLEYPQIPVQYRSGDTPRSRGPSPLPERKPAGKYIPPHLRNKKPEGSG